MEKVEWELIQLLSGQLQQKLLLVQSLTLRHVENNSHPGLDLANH